MSQPEETCQVDVPEFDPTAKVFEDAFREVDKDGNDQLDKKEFRRFMELAGQQKLSQYIFQIIDKDHNGKVSLGEFQEFGRAMFSIVQKGDLKPYLQMIFKACDKGNKGWLTVKEFQKFMKYSGNKVGFFQRKKEFKNWDENGNGKIEFEEIMAKIKFVMANMSKK